MTKKRILHLNSSDTGGAATAVYRLHQRLLERGHESRMLVLEKSRDDETVVAAPTAARLMKKIVRKGLRTPRTDDRYCFYNVSETWNVLPASLLLKAVPFTPDIIIVHWISMFVNAATIGSISRQTGAPVLWYLLDMGALTGGCHYAWDCRGYIYGCGNCPALYSTNSGDLSARNMSSKQKSFATANIKVIPASAWLARQAMESALFKNRVTQTVLLGVDTKRFSPKNKTAARSGFGIEPGSKVVFFGVQHLSDERKGFALLVEALVLLWNVLPHNIRTRTVLLLGGSGDFDALNSIPFIQHRTGFMTDEERLAAAYEAADVYVCPSLEDSGPMMINESLMSGTPVVAFEMGIAPEAVIAGSTGYCVPLRDTAALAGGIAAILNLNEADWQVLSANCRAHALRLFDPAIQLKKIEELFDAADSFPA